MTETTAQPGVIYFKSGRVFRALHFDTVGEHEYVAAGLFDDGSGVQVIDHYIEIVIPMSSVDYIWAREDATATVEDEGLSDERLAEVEAYGEAE